MSHIFENLFPEELYHSYIIEGDPNKAPYEIINFLEERGEVVKNSPDTLVQIYESFTAEDGAEIKDWHSRMKISDRKKVCVIGAKFLNREAEQKLLKVLEEPLAGNHFFVVVPDASAIAPTILSRVHIVYTNNNNEQKNEALKFISLSPKQRIEMIAELVKENKNEDDSGSLRFYAVSLINEIEKIIYQKFTKDRGNKNLINVLEQIGESRKFLNLPGSSPKMILENLAIII